MVKKTLKCVLLVRNTTIYQQSHHGRLLRWDWLGRSCLLCKKVTIMGEKCKKPKRNLVSVVCIDFLQRDFLFVDGVPSVDDVGQDEGNQQTYVEHSAQGELTA